MVELEAADRVEVPQTARYRARDASDRFKEDEPDKLGGLAWEQTIERDRAAHPLRLGHGRVSSCPTVLAVWFKLWRHPGEKVHAPSEEGLGTQGQVGKRERDEGEAARLTGIV